MTTFEQFIERLLETKLTDVKFDIGEVVFSKGKFEDVFIKKALERISEETNIPIDKLKQSINKQIKKYENLAKKSPILFNTIALNIIEDTTFNMFHENKVKTTTGSKFDKRVFARLWDLIRVQYSEFFPLTDFVTNVSIHSPVVMYVPDLLNPTYNKGGSNYVDTAAASPKGEFIFNIHFMQSLIYYADLKGVKPEGKKYVSNGGEIPDDYVYIEFLILHELMHYTRGDFHYHKLLKANGKLINWVGDFRSNYDLVKSGYDQLPMGLFSDLVNSDRQKTYEEMYNLVKKEFDKLDEKDKKEFMDSLSDKTDNHMNDDGEQGDGDDGEQGDDGEDGKEKEGDAGEDGKESKKGKKGKEGKEGKDDKQGDKGDGEQGDEGKKITWDDINKINEEIKEKLKKGVKRDSTTKDLEKREGQASQNSKAGGNYSTSKDTSLYSVDFSKIEPKYDWITLLKKLIGNTSFLPYESYAKPSKRNVSNIGMMAQTGQGAIKPGILKQPNKIPKIVFCVDCSGSMNTEIAKAYAEIYKLIMTNKKIASEDMYIIKFSGQHYVYKVNFSKNEYTDEKNVTHKGAKNVFVDTISGGTNFSSDLAAELLGFSKQNFNIFLFSDEDMIESNNLTNFLALNKECKSLYIFAANRKCYEDYIKNISIAKDKITYLK